MSTDTNTSFAHAFIRDLLNDRLPLGKIADHLQDSFDTIHQASQLAQVQQEFHAYQELCALRERLQRAAAAPLATAQLVHILELPQPHPSGHIARDDRARHQHATLMLRTIDKLNRRTRSRSGGTALQSSVRVEPDGIDLQQSTEPRTTNDTDVATPRAHPAEPARVPPLPSERTEGRVPPVPSERSEEKMVPSGSGGAALQSSVLGGSGGKVHDPIAVPANPDETDLQHSTVTTHTDTPFHKPSLARAG